MNDYLRALRNEFEGSDSSFLIQIRSELHWNKASFSHLIQVMQRCCEDYSNSATLERWMAVGFWYVPFFVRDWTTHPDFPRQHEAKYYQIAYQRLDDLAYWFFIGESPHLAGKGFEPI